MPQVKESKTQTACLNGERLGHGHLARHASITNDPRPTGKRSGRTATAYGTPKAPRPRCFDDNFPYAHPSKRAQRSFRRPSQPAYSARRTEHFVPARANATIDTNGESSATSALPCTRDARDDAQPSLRPQDAKTDSLGLHNRLRKLRQSTRTSQLVRSGWPLRKSPSEGGLIALFLSVSSCSEPTCLSTGGSYGFLVVDGCFIAGTIAADAAAATELHPMPIFASCFAKVSRWMLNLWS